MNRRSTGRALEAAAELLSSIDHSERASLTSSELVAVMHEARRFADRAAALAATVTTEVEAKKSAEAATSTPLTSLISTVEARDARDAAKEVFRAQEVAHHGMVRDAALAGDITTLQAQAVTRGMATLPPLPDDVLARVEARYLEHAEGGATPRKLRSLAPQVLAEVAPEHVPSRESQQDHLAAQRQQAVRDRYFSYTDTGRGSIKFHGLLPELEAAQLISLVEGYVERDRRAARRRLEGLREAKAGPDEIRRLRTQDLDRSAGQRRADALVQVIAGHRNAPTVAGDKPRVVVEMTLAELQERAEEARLVTGRDRKPLAAGELRRLLCDAEIMPVVLGGQSEILDVGQEKRLVTRAMRRALALRDGGCAFPGCEAPPVACDAHHIVPWWAGGPTSLVNLVLLCPHHHSLVEPPRHGTRDQWRVIMDPISQRPRIIPPERHRAYQRTPSTRGGGGGASPPGGGAGPPANPPEGRPPLT